MENSVELIGLYGSDESHALSAWTSTNREWNEDKKSRMPALLKMLAKGSDGNPHGTPFEKSALHFLVNAETASHIQCIKHRIGVSINTESARYKELKEDKYYIPKDWPDIEVLLLKAHCIEAFRKYHDCLERLVKGGMDRKRAKESARFYLPYANQLNFDVMFNFRSFVHFQRLRNGASAQLEIKEIAQQMLELVRTDGRFKFSLEAFGL